MEDLLLKRLLHVAVGWRAHLLTGTSGELLGMGVGWEVDRENTETESHPASCDLVSDSGHIPCLISHSTS